MIRHEDECKKKSFFVTVEKTPVYYMDARRTESNRRKSNPDRLSGKIRLKIIITARFINPVWSR